MMTDSSGKRGRYGVCSRWGYEDEATLYVRGGVDDVRGFGIVKLVDVGMFKKLGIWFAGPWGSSSITTCVASEASWQVF